MRIIETPRLVLRPRALADTRACLEMDGDPEVTRYIPGPWTDPAAHRRLVEARTLGPWPHGMGYWVIEDRRRRGEFQGWILLIPVDAVGPETEIGWRLPRRSWGQGIATEAARAVLSYGFNDLSLDRVIAGIDQRNSGSIAVAEKLGMARDNTAPDAAGMVRYSISSETPRI